MANSGHESINTLRDRFNQETARIDWQSLQPHFAHGSVVHISDKLDLIDIAVAFAEDDKPLIEREMGADRIAVPDMNDAAGWLSNNQEFWAVVVAPWVLIQQVNEDSTGD